jgi:hypothetical protein
VLRDDFLMRMIQRLVELIARAVGLAKKGRHDEAEEAIEEIYKSEIGMPRDMLEKLAPATIASTLGSEKSMLIAALLDAEAQLAELQGDLVRVADRNARADAIRAAAGLPLTRG